METLPYTWQDVWAMQATTLVMRTYLGTVRELISELTEARADLARRARLSGWTGDAAASHRASLDIAGASCGASAEHLAQAAALLAKEIGAHETTIRLRQAALMRQDAARATSATARRT